MEAGEGAGGEYITTSSATLCRWRAADKIPAKWHLLEITQFIRCCRGDAARPASQPASPPSRPPAATPNEACLPLEP